VCERVGNTFESTATLNPPPTTAGGAQSGAARADDHHVEVGFAIATSRLQRIRIAQPAQPTSHRMVAICSARRSPACFT